MTDTGRQPAAGWGDRWVHVLVLGLLVVGPAVVEQAVAAVDDDTVFNRGRTQAVFPEGV